MTRFATVAYLIGFVLTWTYVAGRLEREKPSVENAQFLALVLGVDWPGYWLFRGLGGDFQ